MELGSVTLKINTQHTLENANRKSFEVWTLLRLRNSCPGVRTWGGGILYTEFIQICTIFVGDFDRKHHIHLIL
jgi:hypothetical protein